MSIQQLDQCFVENTYSRFPVTLVSGKGAKLLDENGKEYIDLGSGIAVNTFGAADDVWQKAVCTQMGQLAHTSNLYYTEPCARLAALLCEKTGMKKVFFGNSGAEANECAIKTARKWGHDHKGEGYDTIVTLKNSFHGRTIATLAATGQDSFHTDFGPLPGGFVYAEANNCADLEKKIKENKCCAVMMELVQGEGGRTAFNRRICAFCPPHYGRERPAFNLRRSADRQRPHRKALLLYALRHYAGSLYYGQGLGRRPAIGACVMGEKAAGVLTAGKHGSTFGGNPAVCAGALSILTRLDEALLAGVEKKSAYILSQLQGAKGVKSITGKGLMLGIASAKPAKEVISGCLARGVLVLSAKDKIRLLPPLNIDDALLEKAIHILKEELA